MLVAVRANKHRLRLHVFHSVLAAGLLGYKVDDCLLVAAVFPLHPVFGRIPRAPAMLVLCNKLNGFSI